MAVAVTNTTAGLSGKTLAVLETAQTWTAAQTFSGSIILAATQKLYLDGGGNTYLVEAAADNLQAVVGGSTRLIVNSTGTFLQLSDVLIDATKKFYLDGGGDTYLTEEAANQIRLIVGGVDHWVAGTTHFSLPSTINLIIQPTKQFFLDGGGDTYITESSANNIRAVAGGAGGVELTSGATAWSAVSDERLKTDLVPITGALDKLAGIRAVTGRYHNDERRRAFLIAQDMQRALPEAVSEGEDGFLRLAITDTIPLLVAAVNELRAVITKRAN